MSDQDKRFRASEVTDPMPVHETGGNPNPASDPLPPPPDQQQRPSDDGTYDPRALGAQLASAMELGQYHPVLLFGTAASGKTSLLLSLFSLLETDLRLRAGLDLCNPLLGQDDVAERLHEEAKHTFEIKKLLFIQGRPPPATKVALPFFIPIEFTPGDGKKPVKLAFLESNGEWYRGLEDKKLETAALGTELHAKLRSEIESFITRFRGPMTILYLAPYTQAKVARETNTNADSIELTMASRAIQGLIDSYRRYRVDFRSTDWHQLLVTKWDAASGPDTDPQDRAGEDTEAMNVFLDRHYPEALAALDKLKTDRLRKKPYTAGIINEHGVLQFAQDSDLRGTLRSYPENLWRRLYHNALVALNEPPVSPFPEPPARAPLLRVWDRVLRFVSGD